MRFMIIGKATPDTEAGVFPPDLEQRMAEMGAFHDELARAGVLLDYAGLQPSHRGWRVIHDGGQRRIVQGPFPASGELVAGYTLIDVRSREEAMEWSRRFPNPAGKDGHCEIEVRPLYDLDGLDDAAAARALALLTAPADKN